MGMKLTNQRPNNGCISARLAAPAVQGSSDTYIYIPYYFYNFRGAKFSRGKIFAVFGDWTASAKINPRNFRKSAWVRFHPQNSRFCSIRENFAPRKLPTICSYSVYGVWTEPIATHTSCVVLICILPDLCPIPNYALSYCIRYRSYARQTIAKLPILSSLPTHLDSMDLVESVGQNWHSEFIHSISKVTGISDIVEHFPRKVSGCVHCSYLEEQR